MAAPVTPLAGVWIEIGQMGKPFNPCIVTPLAGVWIEIMPAVSSTLWSFVTPLAGVWIEIEKEAGIGKELRRHSPCGSVD